MTLSGPTEFEAVAARDGLGGGFDPREPGSGGAGDEGRSLWSVAWTSLRRDKAAIAGAVVIIVLVLVAVFADVITGLYGQDPRALNNTGDDSPLDPLTGLPIGPFSGISAEHWLGVTPRSGQDIFAQLVFGARTSLLIGLTATAVSLLLGVSLGLIAGYFRGWVDTLISRFMDLLLSFPTLLFSLALISVVNIVTREPIFKYLIIVFVLGFFSFPYIGRIVRGQVLSLREKEFVDAARSLGAGNLRIMSREIMPNLVGPIIVYTTLSIPTNILGEAGLSYLGLGVPGGLSWGQMLSNAGIYIRPDPFFFFVPGLAIFITVLAFNLLGDGLRDAFDPKTKR